MAIIRRKEFSTFGTISIDDATLIDTPEKLLSYAAGQQITVFPLDVNALAIKLGIRVEPIPMDDDTSGKLYKDEKSGQWIMQVNMKHHPNRIRYTIAHELGHFFLHKHLRDIFEDQIFFRGGETSKEEWQANEFAGAILMPENKFRNLIRSGESDIEKLAADFQVSTLALRMRAKNLGFSGHGL